MSPNFVPSKLRCEVFECLEDVVEKLLSVVLRPKKTLEAYREPS